MAAHNEPYDPYIPNNGAAAPGPAGQAGNARTAALQAVS
jgi:vesicle-associated membrane protein 4